MSRRLPRRRILSGSALLGTASLAGCLTRRGRGEPGPETATTSRSPSSSETRRTTDATTPDVDLEGLETFVDETVPDLLDDHDVVGASMAVVRSDGVELARGFGDADRADGIPVDADETTFRIGSVSKPFVWTAAMQLIEEGRIDPDEDVRNSLESVSISDAYDEPMTVAHLATHTAGFEERFRGTWIDDPDERRALADVLNESQPERVRPPGEIASYSNYGTALAGQLVADVAGTSFEDYVAESLFEPLSMTTATFEQPVPDGVSVSKGYTAFAGTVGEAPELGLEIAPAGAAVATATDVAQLVRALLGDGAVDGGRILESESVDATLDRWFTHHEAVSGIAFGLLEDERRGVRVLHHDGMVPGFYSYLLLVPEYDLGLFLTYNTNTGAAANAEVLDAFFEEFVPRTDAESSIETEPDGLPERTDDLAGTYRGVRIAESTHARLSSTLQAGEIDVSVDDDGYLVTDSDGGTTRWIEREPLVFDEVDGTGTLAFRDDGGELTHLFTGFHAYERISRHESLSLHGGLAGVTALGMVSGLAAWPLSWGWRRFGGGDPSDGPELGSNDDSASSASEASVGDEPQSRSTLGLSFAGPARARWIAGGSIASLFAFVAGVVTLLVLYPHTLLSDPPFAYELVSLLGLLGAGGAAASAGYAVVSWRDGYWGRLSRIHYALVVASVIGFCWLLWYWNLLRVPF
ncbi:class A beta-lactamase-related serine hydrolase [Natrarchaeobius halalkaliphilus]|uniref:Class A beta-lactamase-related serine hydrolase n=1 Tax=Natrarchaeobius halalkaliphilus TaxID=1679091 RepID=A0A3N6LSK3_9EURY|nr:serine hydrolase domain-containing protein [Natrarchaeobius halalkaliphilus]RQG91487.1 class A beta-lactamase-related serine hydrolase [Natrarchaeobius halalkaliphilus]